MKAIYKREMKACLTTPVGYAFMGIFFLLSGAVFAYTTLFSLSADVTSYFTYMLLFSALLLPLLTMKSFSEERRQKTEQVWLTSPVSLWGVVLGKFFAALTLFAGCVFVSALAFPILYRYGEVKTAVLLGDLFAWLLVGAAFIAVGIFVSSLTENQLAAAVLTVGILMVFLGISLVCDYVPVYWLRFVLSGLSVFSRFRNFTQGVFDPAALLYYLSLCFVFLFLTVRVYDRRIRSL